MTIKERITEAVEAVHSGSNSLRTKLGTIFFWQEVAKLADSRLKDAWKVAQITELPSDDEMRNKGEGDHSLASTKLFTMVAKVSKPQERFNLDLFIARAAKKWKIDPVALKVLADDCKPAGTPSLSKRVLERES